MTLFLSALSPPRHPEKHTQLEYWSSSKLHPNILSILAGSSQFTFPIDSVGSGSLCFPNGEVILDAGSYAQYVWSPGGQTTQQISVTAEGSYSVSVIDANGCQGISAAPFVVSNIVKYRNSKLFTQSVKTFTIICDAIIFLRHNANNRYL